jgi:hypothetical protein
MSTSLSQFCSIPVVPISGTSKPCGDRVRLRFETGQHISHIIIQFRSDTIKRALNTFALKIEIPQKLLTFIYNNKVLCENHIPAELHMKIGPQKHNNDTDEKYQENNLIQVIINTELI